MAQQCTLDDFANIPGQQHCAMRGFNAQHTTGLIAQIRKMRGGMQEAEIYAFPVPPLPGNASLASQHRRTMRGKRLRDGHDIAYRREAAGMIVISMTDDHAVQALSLIHI